MAFPALKFGNRLYYYREQVESSFNYDISLNIQSSYCRIGYIPELDDNFDNYINDSSIIDYYYLFSLSLRSYSSKKFFDSTTGYMRDYINRFFSKVLSGFKSAIDVINSSISNISRLNYIECIDDQSDSDVQILSAPEEAKHTYRHVWFEEDPSSALDSSKSSELIRHEEIIIL
jgi:hypothetical protein